MPFLFPFSRYRSIRVIKYLFRQLMTSWTLRFIFDQPLKQWLAGEKEAKTEIQIFEFLENKNTFLDEIKKTFFIVFQGLSISEK